VPLVAVSGKRWSKMKKKSLARAGIDADTFRLRCKRVRYQVSVYERFADRSVTNSPLLNGGYTLTGEACIPIRYSLPALPFSLSSIPTPPAVDTPVDTTTDVQNPDGSDDEGHEEPDDSVDSDVDV